LIHHSNYNNYVSSYKSLEHYYDILKKDKIGLKIEYIDIVKKILKLREIVQEYQLQASDHYISVNGKFKFKTIYVSYFTMWYFYIFCKI